MTDSSDALGALPGAARPDAEGPAAADPGPPAPAAPRVLVIDADPALMALLDEWLCALGWSVVHGSGSNNADKSSSTSGSTSISERASRFELLIVDLPYPRLGGVDSVARVAAKHPKTPILALSSTFFARIECHGPVARALGADCVLAKPASREALTNAVRNLLPR